jgi:hypothetical protein
MTVFCASATPVYPCTTTSEDYELRLARLFEAADSFHAAGKMGFTAMISLCSCTFLLSSLSRSGFFRRTVFCLALLLSISDISCQLSFTSFGYELPDHARHRARSFVPCRHV